MSRIKQTFSDLKQQHKKALIPFITAGDPNLKTSLQLMFKMVEAGANLIELGVPFSDPMADGPVIQKASERALLDQVSLDDVFELVRKFREKNTTTPIILMGYLNPIEIMGYETFAQKASEAGIDGVLTVDCPPEESEDFMSLLKQYNLDGIFLISPTTTAERIAYICEQASGFIYYVSIKGVTGSAVLDIDSISQRLGMIRKQTSIPVGVGFGIRDAKTAALLGSTADAVIVGSANVKLIEQGLANNISNDTITGQISGLLSSMRIALDDLGDR